MITGGDVLEFLIPDGGWVITGDQYENIIFLEAEPITKQEFEAGFALLETEKKEKEIAKAAQKAELLAKLGITEQEAKLLLGGN